VQFLREACFIDGKWVSSDERIAVNDPATGARVGEVPDVGRGGTSKAIDAAHRALPAWRALTAASRAAHLLAMREVLLANLDELAELLTREQGKPLAEAAGEIRYSASYLQWYAEEAKRAYGETIPAGRADQRITVLREPVGVCAAITPWNFPSAMLGRKLAPALAAGCTFVCKPSELTPFSGLAWGVIAERAGLPAGVLNIVTGRPVAIGETLTRSKLVRKLSFTGSTRVGKLLIEQCAGTVKRLSMELGGNAPFIVFDDADLDSAIAGAIASKYRNAGQTCVCANRFLIHANIASDFESALVDASRALRVGPGTDAGTDIGPLVNRAAVDKVRRLVDGALVDGATAVLGTAPTGDSLFCDPVVLSGVGPDMAVSREEIFGPVAAIQTFTTEQQALETANDTDAGLAAYLYTSDAGRITRMVDGLEYGMVGVNEGMISAAQAPFGGIKESGFGREGSRHGLDEYLQLKYVCTRTS
jgi:succinate-semialdehyde dehydrogenase/glutarate-semialdehyde dehydrogenase